MNPNGDVPILRDLARQYADLAAKPIQDERRDLWRRHNSLQPTRPLIYVRWTACAAEIIDPHLRCKDPFYRQYEQRLRQFIFQDTLGDDFILEPWLTLEAVKLTPPDGLWGVPFKHTPRTEERGSWMFDPPLKHRDDIKKLITPRHQIDENATADRLGRLRDALGDLVEINLARRPAWYYWTADISTELARLRGLEQMMWDMADNPDWLHKLVTFMRDGILKAQDEAERAGDWGLADHENQAMPYATELADPKPNRLGVSRRQLWTFCASQETTEVGPAMFDEFILSYQIPIIENFALSAYGCCEDLTRKIHLLRKITNLRRISVTPRANLPRCAEQIGPGYVLSWRPNPADHVCCLFDPEFVRRSVRDAIQIAKSSGCHMDITLKDVETVQNDAGRLLEWTRLVRQTIDETA